MRCLSCDSSIAQPHVRSCLCFVQITSIFKFLIDHALLRSPTTHEIKLEMNINSSHLELTKGVNSNTIKPCDSGHYWYYNSVFAIEVWFLRI